MQLTVIPPLKWAQDPRGEIKYDSEASPYTQIYITPEPGGELFARAQAGAWNQNANALIDDYFHKLATKGYLVTRYRSLAVGDGHAQIASILWPTENRWHRWLVATWAGAPSQGVAPMVIVMNSADEPDPTDMARAFLHMVQTTTASPADAD